MARTIKFRAYHNKENRMFIPKVLCQVKEPDQLIFFETHMQYEESYVDFDENCILMQFTGLLDKNGLEIFESDYVRCESLECEVVWEHGGFHFIDESGSDIDFYTAEYVAQNWEVIGNIYENPELINS